MSIKKFKVNAGRFPQTMIKIVAIVTMLIDHIGACVLEAMIRNGYALGDLYHIARYIGRISFPLFVLMLAEGAFYTSDRMKYLKNLLIFAVISEIPFDMALELYKQSGDIPTGGNVLAYVLEFSHQNVFFTLALGLIAIMLIDRGKLWAFLGPVVIAGLASLLNTDYGAWGVVCICVAYVLMVYVESDRVVIYMAIVLVLTAMSAVEGYSLLGLISVFLYNGQRGAIKGRLKWLFYAFYPLHLAVLAAIKIALFVV
ncbi:MAG: conjugal transfer protein TraX [Eubacterium sp.]|nr:conjugal transfer protein TraX [Eubacterium sp.]